MSAPYALSVRDNAPRVAKSDASSDASSANEKVNRGSARVIPLFTATTASAISRAGAPRRSAHVAIAAAARRNSRKRISVGAFSTVAANNAAVASPERG